MFRLVILLLFPALVSCTATLPAGRQGGVIVNEDSQQVSGWVVIGHEVRTFQPCRDNVPHWLNGDSPALAEIMTEYNLALSDSLHYAPKFMILAGTSQPKSDAGFAHDYPASFRASQLVEVDPQGYCRNENIEVERPLPGERVGEALSVFGKARGSWYFEGDFPLLLTDAAGRVIARGFATAQDPWMTSDWVPFIGVLPNPEAHTGSWGWLILKKDNPSDRAELDDEVAIPVLLK